MLLTDYYRSIPDNTWTIGNQLGVKHGTVRLPEDPEFDLSNKAHWEEVYKRFEDAGIKPVVIEPLPNALHDHIKAGDENRDWAIEQLIKMFPIMDSLDTRIICFNWMAYVGWTRTSNEIMERGGARVTGFKLSDYEPSQHSISEKQLWDNYEYFLKAVIPHAEKYDIKLALHPDDPPLQKLGNVSRIMISAENIEHAVRDIVPSNNLGVTFCQATYHMMGENLFEIIPRFKDKIMFVHFRNARGNKTDFHETFHDNGELDMAKLMRVYYDNGIDCPIRVDHVPTMVGESIENAGYDALGRLFAIGYLKGLLEATSV